MKRFKRMGTQLHDSRAGKRKIFLLLIFTLSNEEQFTEVESVACVEGEIALSKVSFAPC